MLVCQILKSKGDLVFTAKPDETVGAAAAATVSSGFAVKTRSPLDFKI